VPLASIPLNQRDETLSLLTTGKIDSVTIELQEIPRSAAVETHKARSEAVLKKALSD
jgi:hypothetical protein